VRWVRRHWPWLTGPVTIGVAALAGWFIETGDFLIMPGDALNTGAMVKVESGGRKRNQGELLLVTIYSAPANVDEWVFGHLYPNARLAPARTQLPPNTSYERYRHLEEAMMADSQTTAKVVALRQLGYDVPERGEGVVVNDVQQRAPAEQAGIRKGDLLLALNRQPVQTAGQLFDRLGQMHPGDSLIVTLKPNNSDTVQDVETTLRARPNQPDRGFLGIVPRTYRPIFEFPVQVSIDSKGIIGPSAGLVLTLAVMQAGGPEDITHGHRIAATGTMDLSGNVGPVGGTADKVRAADGRAEYFLVPKADLDDAKRAARRTKVVEANTLSQALDFLETLA
jgi:PDZ domain-containing protein